MKQKEQEILEELKRLASDDAAQQIADFFIFALTQEEVRATINNEQANKIYLTIELLKEAAKLPE